MKTPAEIQANRIYSGIHFSLSALVLLIASGLLFIWIFIPELKEFSSGSMKVNTCIGFIASGIVLVLLGRRRFRPLLTSALSAFVMLLGFYTIGEYFFHFPSVLDDLFVSDFPSQESLLHPGRMSPIAAILFFLTGIGFLLKSQPVHRLKEIGVYFFIPIFSASLLIIIGYLYDLRAFYSYGPFIRISWQSAVTFLCLSTAVFFLRERGISTLLTSRGPGGMMARRLLPTVSFFPIFLGYAWLIVRRNDYVSRELAIAFYVLIMIAVLFIVIMTIARKLDVLERERSSIEKQELVTREKLSAVMATSPLIIWAVDLEGKFTLCEGGGLQGMNLSEKEMVGKDFYEFNRDNPLVIDYVKRALKGEQFFAESEFLNRYHNSNYSPLRDSTGRIIGVSVVTFDITELKLAQSGFLMERINLRNLFTQTPEIFGILRKDYVFEYANDALKKFYGFDPTGKSVISARPEAKETIKLLDSVFKTGETIHLFETRTMINEKAAYFNMTYAARKDQEGKIDGLMFLGLDVTDQVEARLNLQKAVQARDEFLSIASHELKTPITSFLIQLQLVDTLRARGDERAYEAKRINSLVEMGTRQLMRINRLVDDMLDIARINTGKLSFRKEPVQLNDILQEVIARMRFLFEKEETTLILSQTTDIELTLDRIRIDQVLTNVLSNALRYGKKNPVTISLVKEEKLALISVTDQGLGMAPEILEKIFNRFERGVNANEFSGLGLGLYISRQIVESHGGKIEARSDGPGKGSTILIFLPTDKGNS